MVNAAFNVFFSFITNIFTSFAGFFVRMWGFKIAATTFYITSIIAAALTLYIGAGALLGTFVTAFPADSIFYGFMFMAITPNIPACITAVASAWVLLKVYQLFILQARFYTAVVNGSPLP
ncbi:MAG: DUF5455 family protein [Formivibrio sp.]|nr:DUF5455 family protein [Formivibrio sp.]MDR3539818.1 DUF5455 family protein [Desulfosporosinus sp.]